MTTAVVTSKGQIVIPSEIRKHLKIKGGTKVAIQEEGDRIVLRPLTADYFDKMAGLLKTKGKLTKALLEERARERLREEKKWKKS